MHSCTPFRARVTLPKLLGVTCALMSTLALTSVVSAQQTTPATPAAQAKRARVTGRVVDAATNQPLSAANIFILGTPITATTGADGRFVIASAPPGIYTIEAKRLGYGAERFENTRLRADSVTTLEFKLTDHPMMLDQVTVGGTVDATSVAKSTLAISTLSTEDMPVPTTGSAAGMIQGKVSGVSMTRPSGAPGSGVSIVLRTPIGGIDQANGASGNGSAPGPLFIVDGVFLNSQQAVTTADIEALDVANIEVIKGAAAASLYGARAAAGVISITTNRGKNLALGTTQFSFRSEYAADQFVSALHKNQHHAFLQDTLGRWLNATGDTVPRSQRIIKPLGIEDSPFYSPTYDNQGFLNAGHYNTQTATVQYNSAPANYLFSYARTQSPGLIPYNEGYKRQSIRLNIDSRINEKLNISMSANHTRSLEDAPPTSTTFYNFYRIDADVDLKKPDPFPKFGFPYLIVPDSVTNYTNPLYSAFIADNYTRRARTNLDVNGNYRPFSWLSFNADASYDRGDLQQVTYTARGTPTNSSGTLGTSTGSLAIENDITDGYRIQSGGTITKGLGALTIRLTDYGVAQREQAPSITSTGTQFLTEGVKSMSQASVKAVTQSYTDRRSIANITTLNLSLKERYIGDFLINREGNSLFGRANRWNTFGRASGAWVLSEEKWFPFASSVNQLKLRYSYGVAGQVPGFSQQYEALASDGSGGITRSSLGNPNILPTRSAEQEAGIDITFKQRVSGQFTYVSNYVSDVFVAVPAPAVSGYATQTVNPAVITGNTLEATIQGQILQNPKGLQWTVLLVADHSRNFTSKWGRTCFADGIQYRCDKVRNGTFWGNRLLSDKANLPTKHVNSLGQFDINDEGWVVPVGTGNTWRDGVAKNLWGTSVLIDGTSYAWGRPIPEVVPSTGQLWYGQIGDGNPKMHFGLNNNFRYKNFRFYVQVSGQLGGQVYSNSNQTFYASGDAEIVDNFGRPDELKKPVAYYNALANNNNLYLSNFVESASYASISEALFGYTFDSKQYPFLKHLGLNRAQLDLVGRNLKTFTKYDGLNVAGGTPLNRVDDATYPLARTWSGVFSLFF